MTAFDIFDDDDKKARAERKTARDREIDERIAARAREVAKQVLDEELEPAPTGEEGGADA
jgi:hypothetical protein